MTERRRGMDHGLYSFSPLPARLPLRWPGGARVAVTVFLYFEHWELAPPTDAVREPQFGDTFGTFFPDYRTYTWREYGNRVGIFRLFEALDRSGLAVTVPTNSGACEQYPFLVEEMLRRGWEFAAHGAHATRMISSHMTEAEERTTIADSVAMIERHTGRRPAGWVGQDYGKSTRTPHLLAEAGLDYVVDWPNDDQPYRMTVGRPLVSIPNQAEWDDVQLLWHRRLLSPRYPEIVGEALRRLHDEAEASGRFFGLHLHPWLSGMPHRFPYIADAIARVVAIPNLWRATACEVAHHILRDKGEARA